MRCHMTCIVLSGQLDSRNAWLSCDYEILLKRELARPGVSDTSPGQVPVHCMVELPHREHSKVCLLLRPQVGVLGRDI